MTKIFAWSSGSNSIMILAKIKILVILVNNNLTSITLEGTYTPLINYSILNHVTECLEDIEDDVFNNKIVLTKRSSLLRRDIATLSRIAIPLKQIIMEIMTKDIQNLLDEKDIQRQQEDGSKSANDLVLFLAI